MRGHTQINSRQQAKNEYYKNTGQKLRIPAYQTNFLQPPQVAPSVKPPSIHKQTLKKPIFNNVDPPDPKKLWKKPLQPALQQPVKSQVYKQNKADTKKNSQIARGSVTGSIRDSSQTYIAEISDSQKLSNTIYKSVVKSQQHLVPFINPEVITKVLSHYNISNASQINREKLENLFKILHEIADKMKTKELESSVDVNNMGAMTGGGQAVGNEMYDRDTKRETYTICIDSNDRYRQYWPNSNEYQILFGRESSSNSKFKELGFSQDIQRTFHNVEKVVLKEVIIPYNKNETYHKLPYILLEIKELGSNFWGSNSILTKSFAKLTLSEQKGEYLYYRVDVNEKIFNPRIELSSLTIRFLDPEGNLIRFGSDIDMEIDGSEREGKLIEEEVVTITQDLDEINDDDFAVECLPIRERHNLLTFEITSIQKVFQSVFLH